jgi:hypothetical protein
MFDTHGMSASRIIFRIDGSVDVTYRNGRTINYAMMNYQAALVNRSILADTAQITREMANVPIPVKPDITLLCIFISISGIIYVVSPVFSVITLIGTTVMWFTARAKYDNYWRNTRR